MQSNIFIGFLVIVFAVLSYISGEVKFAFSSPKTEYKQFSNSVDVNKLPELKGFTVRDEFDSYRKDAINFLNFHSQNHPKCILTGREVILSKVNLYFYNFEEIGFLKSWIMVPHFGEYPNIFVNTNPNYPWTKKSAIFTFIHESLHLDNICGPDRIRRQVKKDIASCTLWHNTIMNASDLDRALEIHLDSDYNKFIKTQEIVKN